MKKLIFFATIFVAIQTVNANDHKSEAIIMSKQECSELKDGITELLMIADYYWKEAERDSENKELYEAIAFYSQQAANYSTVYDVWCN